MAKAATPAAATKNWPPMARISAPLDGWKVAGEVVDAVVDVVGVVVTGADPEAVADGVVALPAGKGGMMVAEVDTGIGAITVGVVAEVVATEVGVELVEEVVVGVELDEELDEDFDEELVEEVVIRVELDVELDEELDEELVEVKDAVAAVGVPLVLSHA